MYQEAKSLFDILGNPRTDATRTTHQPRLALPPLGVETFHDAGQSAPFLASRMLTREQFQTLYDQGPDALFDLFTAMQAQIDALTARVQELEDRLHTDSPNSSKPPSSDGFKKPISLRKPTGRKPGGQSGHPGRTLAFSDTPDAIGVHSPAACACGGKALATVEGSPQERRQGVDLPPLGLVTTEHRAQKKVCPDCGLEIPTETEATVQYGPRLKALRVYLLDFQLWP